MFAAIEVIFSHPDPGDMTKDQEVRTLLST
jgi:hypothetical protein